MDTLLLGVPLRRFSSFLFVFLLLFSGLRAQVDSLIDVDSLEKLNAIRYDLNGDGTVDDVANVTIYTAAFGSTPCPAGVSCVGYELVADLDFKNGSGNTDEYSIWAEASTATDSVPEGWVPIGSSSSSFTGTFDGNGHTISNLYINYPTTDRMGLFSRLDVGGIIRNVGMEDVNVTGFWSVGGLVGVSSGTITTSYAMGDVTGMNYVGGLVGENYNTITTSYATGTVTGDYSVGGLAGRNDTGSVITASYATGDVTGTGLFAGGLAGWNDTGSAITTSYATGDVSGTFNVGGLVGHNSRGSTITASYYDSAAVITGNIINTTGAQTTAVLQGTATFTDLYTAWAVDVDGHAATGDDIVWDLGTDYNYPALKVDFNGNDGPTVAEFGTQVRVRVPKFTVSPIYFYVKADATTIGKVIAQHDRFALTCSLVFQQQLPDTPVSVFLVDSSGNVSVSPGGLSDGDRYRLLVRASTTTNPPATAEVIVFVLVGFDPPDADSDGLMEVSTLAQLNAIRYDLNGDGTVDDAANATIYTAAFGFTPCPDGASCMGYELTASLDFKNGSGNTDEYSIWAEGSTATDSVPEGWVPIGSSSSSFTGAFDGNGHTISNLYINRPSTGYVGLLGHIGKGGSIRNVGMEDVNVTGAWNAGGLVGRSQATIMLSYATGTVTGTSWVGGLVGGSSSTITVSYATGTVTGTGDSVGGLVGYSSNTITASYATGDVTGTNNVGGLVGWSQSTITSSYAMGTVMGTDRVGGLVGWSQSTITSSYVMGAVMGTDKVGGLVGDSTGPITLSYYPCSAVVTKGGMPVPPDATAKTTIELASSTSSEPALSDASGTPSIFADWNVRVDTDGDAFTPPVVVWDFGVRNQFPVLRIDVNGDGMFSAEDLDAQDREASPVVYFPSPEFVVAEADGQAVVSVAMFNAPAAPVAVSVLVSDGTATSPDDYTHSGGVAALSFDSSSAVDFLTTQTFAISIVDNNVFEGDETILLSFDAPPPGVLAEGSTMAAVRIDDLADALRVRFTAVTAEAMEGETVTISVSIFPAPADPVEVPIIVLGGTATLDDYTGAPALLSFSSQATTASFTVMIVDDAVAERDETITFGFGTLPRPIAPGTPSMFVLTIEGDSHAVSFVSASLSVGEGVGRVEVLLSISPPVFADVFLPIAAAGTADATDYVRTDLVAYAGSPIGLFFVDIVDDAVAEGDETIVFSFDALPDDIVVGTPSMFVLTIAPNDMPDATPAMAILDEREPVYVYPNPVREVLYIFAPSPIAYEATLYTLSGVPILSAVASPSSLSVGALSPGVYLLSVFFDDTTHLYRLLKE